MGDTLSGVTPDKGEASNGGTFATGFCTFGAVGGDVEVGLTGSSTGGAGGAGVAGTGGLLENRLAHDLPGAGCGCGGAATGGGSVRLRGVGGGGKSEAVGAGGGGCGVGGGSGTLAPALRECPNGALPETINGCPGACKFIDIGMGALLGGSGGSRFTCSTLTFALSLLSAASFDGDRFDGPSRFCLLPKGAFGVDTVCCTGMMVCGAADLGGGFPPENGAAGPLVVFPAVGGTLLAVVVTALVPVVSGGNVLAVACTWFKLIGSVFSGGVAVGFVSVFGDTLSAVRIVVFGRGPLLSGRSICLGLPGPLVAIFRSFMGKASTATAETVAAVVAGGVRRSCCFSGCTYVRP